MGIATEGFVFTLPATVFGHYKCEYGVARKVWGGNGGDGIVLKTLGVWHSGFEIGFQRSSFACSFIVASQFHGARNQGTTRATFLAETTMGISLSEGRNRYSFSRTTGLSKRAVLQALAKSCICPSATKFQVPSPPLAHLPGASDPTAVLETPKLNRPIMPAAGDVATVGSYIHPQNISRMPLQPPTNGPIVRAEDINALVEPT